MKQNSTRGVPAPALPARKPLPDDLLDVPACAHAAGWNACLDAFASGVGSTDVRERMAAALEALEDNDPQAAFVILKATLADGVTPCSPTQELPCKVWREAGGSPAITEPTEQEVLDLVHGMTKLADEAIAEEAAAGVKGAPDA